MADEKEYSYDESCADVAVSFLIDGGFAKALTEDEFEKASNELAQEIQNTVEAFLEKLGNEPVVIKISEDNLDS